MPAASAPLLTALKASLQDAAHGWQVGAYVENDVKEPTTIAGGVTISSAIVRKERIVSLFSPLIRIAPGERAPLGISYIGALNAADVYQSATLIINGTAFTTTDSALHTIVMAMVSTVQTDTDADITASLTLGPQVFE